MIERCVSCASFIDTIALLLSHERFFHLLLESFSLMKLSPREVDRYLYGEYNVKGTTNTWFPAPREVDRYLYKITIVGQSASETVSGPSRGRTGASMQTSTSK